MNKLVSYCIFSYNQEQYIKEALEGAFKQTYSPLEIIISDDCSTDETYNIITEITKNYKGKHKILINKNEKNLGIGGNFAFVAYSLAKGEYLITVGGDDISKEDHVEKAIQNILDHPGIFMMDFNADIINENGSLIRNIPLEFDCKKFCLEEYLNLKPIKSFAPGRIINMNQLKIYDPIDQSCPTEDSVLVIRSLLLSGFIRKNISLIFYRLHANNLSNSVNIKKLSHSRIINQYLCDLTKVFWLGLIDFNLYERILKRIVFELKLKKMVFYGGVNNKILNKFIILILKVHYKIKNTFCHI